MRNAEPRTTKRLEENVRFNVVVSLEYTVYYAAHSQVRQAAGNGRKAWYLSTVQSKVESPARAARSIDGNSQLLVSAPPMCVRPYFEAHQDRTNKLRPGCERPDRYHAVLPNRS